MDLDEFTPDRNVGIVLGAASGGLVDIDLDDPVAIKAAPYLLPDTDAVFGRPSKRSSHRLYQVDEPGRTVQSKGSDGHMIVELRGNGAQTMVPPSLHPDGERLEFERNGDPATATRAELESGPSVDRCRRGARPALHEDEPARHRAGIRGRPGEARIRPCDDPVGHKRPLRRRE